MTTRRQFLKHTTYGVGIASGIARSAPLPDKPKPNKGPLLRQGGHAANFADTRPLSTLAPNTARIVGPYANPDPQFTSTVPRTWPGATGAAQLIAADIVDDGGLCYDAAGHRILIFGGGHGPSVETDIRCFDLATLQWSSLYPSTPVSEMRYDYVVANGNIDVDKGRYVTSNQPTSRHAWRLQLVRGRSFYLLQWRGLPDWVVPSQQFWGGRICWYDFDSKQWSYSKIAEADTPWYFASAAQLDPVSQNFIVVGATHWGGGGAPMWLYDPIADSITTGPIADVGPVCDLVHCPDDDTFYAFQSDGRVWKIVLDRQHFTLSTITPLAVTGTPPSNPVGYNVGVAYDTINKVFAGQIQDGYIFVFDPRTAAWSKQSMQLEQPWMWPPTQSDACLTFDPASGCFIFLQNPSYPPGNKFASTWAYRLAGSPVAALPASIAAGPLGATLDFGNGRVATFSMTTSVDTGDFIGEFVHQKSFLATDPNFPDWRVWFRPDADGSRDEVVVEYGRAIGGQPTNVTQPYTASIRKGDAVVYTATVPAHYWYSRWRYQSAPRPVVRTPDVLKSRGWVPNFGPDGMYGGGPSTVACTWPGPMGVPASPPPTYPFNPGMEQGGDHDEIGLLTESSASYMIFAGSEALANLRTEGEWCGNWSIHIRDAAGNMPDFRDLTSGFVKDGGSINADPTTPYSYPPGWVNVEASHWYANANGPWLLTEDPFMLEEIQFGVNWRILYDFVPRKSTKLGALMYPGQTRSFAWGLRDLFLLACSTPDTVPGWLQPKAHWQQCVADNKAFALGFVNSPARIHALFRTWTRGDFDSSWMSAWLTTVVGMAIEQGFTDWMPVFEWSVGKQIAMTSGTSGWNRQWPAPYRSVAIKDASKFDLYRWMPYTDTSIDAATCTDWADYWAFYKSGGNGHSDDTGHVVDDSGWDGHTLMATTYRTGPDQYNPPLASPGSFAGWSSFFLHVRAALAIAAHHDIPGAQACYDYLHGETANAFSAVYRATGQARFALDP